MEVISRNAYDYNNDPLVYRNLSALLMHFRSYRTFKIMNSLFVQRFGTSVFFREGKIVTVFETDYRGISFSWSKAGHFWRRMDDSLDSCRIFWVALIRIIWCLLQRQQLYFGFPHLVAWWLNFWHFAQRRGAGKYSSTRTMWYHWCLWLVWMNLVECFHFVVWPSNILTNLEEFVLQTFVVR